MPSLHCLHRYVAAGFSMDRSLDSVCKRIAFDLCPCKLNNTSPVTTRSWRLVTDRHQTGPHWKAPS